MVYFSYLSCGTVCEFLVLNSQFENLRFPMNFFITAGILTIGSITYESQIKIKYLLFHKKNMKILNFSGKYYFSCTANIIKLLCSESYRKILSFHKVTGLDILDQTSFTYLGAVVSASRTYSHLKYKFM